MAFVLADRVKETTITTGTGTVTLVGASVGYQSFSAVGNGNSTYYTIAGQTTSEWEVGIGTYTSAGTTLSRTTVLASSNGGSLVTFSAGTKDVFVTYPAGRSVNVDSANTVVSVPQLSATSISDSGNLTFTGTGNRITGDFSNATFSSRVMFQSSTVNGNTVIEAVPNGTGTQGAFNAINGSDPTNGVGINILAISTETRLQSFARGTGTYLPLALYTSGSNKFNIAADTTGTFTFGGTAPRITGDMSNATISSRVAFQTSTANGDTRVLAISNGTGTTSAFAALNGSDANNASWTQISTNATTSLIQATISGTGTYLPMVFQTGGSERMRLDTSGNLGVGFSTVPDLLAVYSASAARFSVYGDGQTQINAFRYSTDASAPQVGLAKSRGTYAAPTAVASGDQMAAINFQAYGGTNRRTLSIISSFVDTYTSDTNISSYLLFGTSPSGSAASTERMRIDSSGNVGIGTTPSYRLQVLGPTRAASAYGVDTFIASSAADVTSYYNSTRLTLQNTNSTSGTFASIGFLSANANDYAAIWGSCTTHTSAAAVGYLAFGTNNGAGAATERMRITSGGVVGIGTNIPATFANILTVQGTTAILGNASLTGSNPTYTGALRLIENPTTIAATGGIEFLTSTYGSGYGWKMTSIDSSGVQLTFATRQNSATWTEAMRIDSSGTVTIGNTVDNNTRVLTFNTVSGGSSSIQSITLGATNQDLTFSTTYATLQERMRITGQGNVGIGTTTPTGKLEVNGGALGGTSGNQTILERLYGTVTNASYLDVSLIRDSTGTSWINAATRLQQKIDSTWMGFMQFNGTNNQGGITFGAGTSTVSATSISEYMYLTSTGNVGIGTSSPAAKLDVYGAAQISYSGANTYLYFQSTSNFVGRATDGNLWTNVAGGQNLLFGIGASEKMRIDSSGNVGIGTSSPSYKLQVSGSLYQDSGYATLGNYNAGTTGTSPVASGISFGTNITNGQAEGDIWNGVDPATYANTGILFTQRLTSSTRRDLVFMHNNGNVGIGTNSPVNTSGYTTLQINNATNGGMLRVTNGTQSYWNYVNSGGAFLGTSSADPLIIQTNNTERMRIDSSGNVGIGTTSSTAKLSVNGGTSTSQIRWEVNNAAYVQEVSTNAAQNAYVYKMQDASYYTWKISGTEQMRFDSSGNVLVGTTSTSTTNGGIVSNPNNGGTGSSAIIIGHKTGTASGDYFNAFIYNGSVIGSITQSGTTAVLYNTTSDQRLKENIQDAESASALIDALQVRQFDWKTDNTHQRYGFIAQELVTVAPEAVHQPVNEEEMMAVDYSKLVPMLVKAHQEQQALITSLTARITALEST